MRRQRHLVFGPAAPARSGSHRGRFPAGRTVQLRPTPRIDKRHQLEYAVALHHALAGGPGSVAAVSKRWWPYGWSVSASFFAWCPANSTIKSATRSDRAWPPTAIRPCDVCAQHGRELMATLNKSLAARSSLLWAVCGVANPRHSWAMAVVCALQPIPNQGAHTRGDLFSVALMGCKSPVGVPTWTHREQDKH